MHGKILNYNQDKGFGFILGQDNQKYFFHISNVENPLEIKKNYNVEFYPKWNKKGLVAESIVVSTPHTSKATTQDKFLKLDTHRIRASEIKRYRIEKEYDYADENNHFYLIIDTFDGAEIKIYLCMEGYSYNGIDPNHMLAYLDSELGG